MTANGTAAASAAVVVSASGSAAVDAAAQALAPSATTAAPSDVYPMLSMEQQQVALTAAAQEAGILHRHLLDTGQLVVWVSQKEQYGRDKRKRRRV